MFTPLPAPGMVRERKIRIRGERENIIADVLNLRYNYNCERERDRAIS